MDSKYSLLIDQVDIDRIMRHIEELGHIGKTENGGVTRLAFTEEDRKGRELIIDWMEQAGLHVRVSPIGNITGRLDGKKPNSPVVMTGSHIDTVINGGKFDGAVGVITAIEVARVLWKNRIKLECPLEVACFVMEESARFNNGYGFGSQVMTGQPISDDMLNMRGGGGKTMALAIQEMKGTDLRDKEVEVQALLQTGKDIEASRMHQPIRAFVELHIEQGPILESLEKPIGIPTAVAAPTRLRVRFLGKQGHSGTTPMDSRRDALAAAAEAILIVEETCKQESKNGIVGTVGVIKIEPGAINQIPGKAEIGIDIRGVELTAKRRTVEKIVQSIQRAAQKRGVECTAEKISDENPISLSARIIAEIERACFDLGINSHRMVSRAGHDAAHLAKVVDGTGMIFIPSKDGISHQPNEWTSKEDILLGAQVLLLTLIRLAF